MLTLVRNKRWRAPQSHGGVLIDPPLSAADAMLAQNQAILATATTSPRQPLLVELAAQARSELVRAALRYTSAYRDIPDYDASQPIILAGHQPQLFHAGVWFKNFALSHLAEQLNAVPVNLLIDNDIHKQSAIRVPSLQSSSPTTFVSFDRSSEAIPYEERTILDQAVFRAFGKNVQQTLGDSQRDPIIGRLWPLAIEAAAQSPRLGNCLAQARHRLEAMWSLQTLELPLSEVCQTRSFARFAFELLLDAASLHRIYNASLAEYRRIHRLRSRSHPVPDLSVEGSWLEVPLWGWTQQRPHRQRLFAQSSETAIKLSDRQSIECEFPLRGGCVTDETMQRWFDLAARGIRIRPRALLTTMYARLVMGDLFLHGIGGAKYDQLTDAIIRQFFAFQPPDYITISATALLQDDHVPELAQQLRDTTRTLRELKYHPERYIATTSETERLAADKRRWIERAMPPGDGKIRHQAIEQINQTLYSTLRQREHALTEQRDGLLADLRQQRQLASREFSFCLFSEATLRPLLLDLCRPAS